MKLTEIKKNLFDVPDEYALAHCISADFALGAGIAKEFNKRYKCKEKLFMAFENSWTSRWDKSEYIDKGNCIILFGDRTIFNLVTKRNYWNKPTMATLETALRYMKEQCNELEIDKIAMPRIGCGLDKLDWSDVKPLIEKVFADTNMEIVICSL